MEKINDNQFGKIIYTLLSDKGVKKINLNDFISLIVSLINILGTSYMETILQDNNINFSNVFIQDFITGSIDNSEVSFSLDEKFKSEIKEKYNDIFLKIKDAMLLHDYCEKSIINNQILVDFKNENSDGIYSIYCHESIHESIEIQIFTDGNITSIYSNKKNFKSTSISENVNIQDSTYAIFSTCYGNRVKKIEVKSTTFNVEHLIEEIEKIKKGFSIGYMKIGNSNPKKYMLIRH